MGVMPDPITSSRRDPDYASNDCDEETRVCGASHGTEPRACKSTSDDDFHAPCLPTYGGVSPREVAENMSKGSPVATQTSTPSTSAPPQPKLDQLTYKELHAEMTTLQHELVSSGDYSGKAHDTARMQALEGEELRRRAFVAAQSAPPPAQGGDTFFAKGDLDHGVQVYAGVAHGVTADRVEGAKVTTTMDVLTARGAIGTKNDDGSTGLHVIASWNWAGAEVDTDDGKSSSAVGIAAGAGVDLSIGMREGALCYRFGGIGIKAITFGACMSDDAVTKKADER